MCGGPIWNVIPNLFIPFHVTSQFTNTNAKRQHYNKFVHFK